jgi:hypothetical protein
MILGANPALYSRKLMHYAQLELDRIKTNVRPQQLQVKPDPVQVLESAYHMTTLDAQNEVKRGKLRDFTESDKRLNRVSLDLQPLVSLSLVKMNY